MTEPTPGHEEATPVDKLDSDKIEQHAEKTSNSVLEEEEEYEPVVTPKTWLVVGVSAHTLAL
jgi:hypothetical protein